MEADRKPCPFCGSEVYQGRGWTRPYCETCGALGPLPRADVNAIAAWNTRSSGLDREEVARIIDPWSYKQYEWAKDDDIDAVRNAIKGIEQALAKADLIISGSDRP